MLWYLLDFWSCFIVICSNLEVSAVENPKRIELIIDALNMQASSFYFTIVFVLHQILRSSNYSIITH